MKRIIIAAMAAALLSACGSSSNTKDGDSTKVATEQTQYTDGQEYTENGVVKLYFAPIDMQKDSTIAVRIEMVPDESLPKIGNENLGKTFCDNKAIVTFRQNGQDVMQKSFTKHSFDSYISSSLMSGAILYRLQFQGFEGNAVKLLAVVTVPHSDEEAGVVVTVSPDGSTMMQKFEVEEVPEEL